MKNYSRLLSVFLLLFSWNISAQDYLGQWIQNDSGLLEITEDSIYQYAYNADEDCLDLLYYEYTDVNGEITISVAGFPYQIPYTLSDDNTILITNFNNELDTFNSGNFLLDDYILCGSINDEFNWSCVNTGSIFSCQELTGQGDYATEVECLAACSNTTSVEGSWACVIYSGISACVELEGGQYETQEDCDSICSAETDGTWSCFTFDGLSACVEAVGGESVSEEACSKICNPSDGTWDCALVFGFSACVEANDGEFSSQQECEELCNITTDEAWNCVSIAGASGCFEVEGGEFVSEEECQETCISADSTWDCVSVLGVSGCLAVIDGQYISEEACQEACFSSIQDYDIGVIISPNPFNDKTLLEFSNSVLRYQLVDFTGRIVLDKKVVEKQEYLYKNNLSNGLYILQLIGDNQLRREKVLID